MKRILLLFVFNILIGLGSSLGQSTTFGSLITGDWTSWLNWSNGVPDEFTDATIDGFLTFNCNVNGDGICNNLTHTNSSTLKINKYMTLTIRGNLYLGSSSTLTNNGQILLFGNYFFNSIQRIETGTGSITINSSIETN